MSTKKGSLLFSFLGEELKILNQTTHSDLTLRVIALFKNTAKLIEAKFTKLIADKKFGWATVVQYRWYLS